jgi:uncharacterized protein YraI
MRYTANLAVVRVLAAAAFIAAAGVLVQSFAEGDQEAGKPSIQTLAATDLGFLDSSPAPLKVKTVKVAAPASPEADSPAPLPLDDPRWQQPAAPVAWAAGAWLATPAAGTEAADPTHGAGASPLALAAAEAAPPMPVGDMTSAAPATEDVVTSEGLASSGEADEREVLEIDIAVVAAAARQFSESRSSKKSKVTSDVRMRSRGSSKAAVIGVIPQGSEIEIIECDRWCEVSFEGKRGFIYGNFVAGQSRKSTGKRTSRRSDPTTRTKAVAQAPDAEAGKGSWIKRLFGGGEDQADAPTVQQ